MKAMRILGMCLVCLMLLFLAGSMVFVDGRESSHVASPSPSILGFDDPKWAIGMEWRYTAEIFSFGGQPFTLRGNVTMRINATMDVKIGNTTYTTFKITIWGGGRMKGSMGGYQIEGPWFMQGRTNTLTTRTANVQTETYINISATQPLPIKATSYILMNWTPPLDPYDFPMNLSDKWTYTGLQETYNWTYVQGMGYIGAPTHSQANITQNFTVVKDEYKSVPAGVFYSYLVKTSSLLLQPIPGMIGDEYYAEAAGNVVAFVMVDNTSQPTGFLNLTGTNYPAPPSKYGIISGVVSDQKGPLPDVNVILISGGKQIGNNKSDPSGKYSFSTLTPATYDLLANKSGYEDASVTGIIVIAGKTVTKDILMKKPEGTLEVNVKDSASKVVADATVAITGTASYNGKTDASGKLTTVLPKGQYSVSVSKTGYKNVSTSASISSGSKSYANLTLEPTKGKLSGKILDLKTGLPIVNAIVSLTKNGTSAGQTTSSSSGAYSFDLDAGTYQISVSAAGYVSKNESVTIAPGQAVVKDVKLSPEEEKVPEKPAESFPMWLALIPIVIVIVILLLYFMLRKKKPQPEYQPQSSMKKRK